MRRTLLVLLTALPLTVFADGWWNSGGESDKEAAYPKFPISADVTLPEGTTGAVIEFLPGEHREETFLSFTFDTAYGELKAYKRASGMCEYINSFARDIDDPNLMAVMYLSMTRNYFSGSPTAVSELSPQDVIECVEEINEDFAPDRRFSEEITERVNNLKAFHLLLE